MMHHLLPKEACALRDRVLELAEKFNRAARANRLPAGAETPEIHVITYAFAALLGEPFKAVSGSVVNTYRRPIQSPQFREGKLLWKPTKGSERPDPSPGFGAEIWVLPVSHSWLALRGPDQFRIQLRPHGALPDLLAPSMSRLSDYREAYEEGFQDPAFVPDTSLVIKYANLLRKL